MAAITAGHIFHSRTDCSVHPGTAVHSAPDRDGFEPFHHTLGPGSHLAAPVRLCPAWVVSEGPNGIPERQKLKLPVAPAS